MGWDARAALLTWDSQHTPESTKSLHPACGHARAYLEHAQHAHTRGLRRAGVCSAGIAARVLLGCHAIVDHAEAASPAAVTPKCSQTKACSPTQSNISNVLVL